jgi:pimeloyl-ACP methyl ester carboxylesterase
MDGNGIDQGAADIIGLIHASDRQRACLVGHDWGAVVAWWVALTAPERLEKLVILNGPHPVVMRSRLAWNLKQILRSWYVFGFQVPWLPERLLSWRNWRLLVRGLRRTSRAGAFTDEDFEQYRRVWSRPGAITAMLNWYRALVRHRPRLTFDPRVTVTTLVIWGGEDRFLGREMAAQSAGFCDDGRLIVVDDATHWIQHERADQVNELITSFLREHG